MLTTGKSELSEADEIYIGASYVLRSNFRGSDYIVRYFTDQFLVVLPDADDQQAQLALSRLIDKLDHWNLGNEKCEIALRLESTICPPGENLWEKLRELEERMHDKSNPECRTLISRNKQVRIFL